MIKISNMMLMTNLQEYRKLMKDDKDYFTRRSLKPVSMDHVHRYAFLETPAIFFHVILKPGLIEKRKP